MSLSDYTMGLGLEAKARTEVRLNEIKANLFIQPRGHHRSHIGVSAPSIGPAEWKVSHSLLICRSEGHSLLDETCAQSKLGQTTMLHDMFGTAIFSTFP